MEVQGTARDSERGPISGAATQSSADSASSVSARAYAPRSIVAERAPTG